MNQHYGKSISQMSIGLKLYPTSPIPLVFLSQSLPLMDTLLFTQRGKNVGTRPKVYDTSVIEGLSRPIDRGTTGEAPDVYRCACRGLAEELGLYESVDFSVADITFLSFGVDTRYALRGLTGMVKINRSIEKLLSLWDNGVKG